MLASSAVHLSLGLFSLSLSLYSTLELHFFPDPVGLAAPCKAAEETLSLISLNASTCVTPGPVEIGIR